MKVEKEILSCWQESIATIRKNVSLGFCLSHLEILIIVYLNDGITRQDLINQLEDISQTTIKRYVSDMVCEHHYITETSSDEDTRIKHLHISGKGHELVGTLVEKARRC